jgi:hypothetical protein
MNTKNIFLTAGAAVAALAGSLSLKASRPFGAGNLWCRITTTNGPQCIKAVTAHTTVTSGRVQPSTQCTLQGGTLVTKASCASGSTWRTASHAVHNGLLKQVTN